MVTVLNQNINYENYYRHFNLKIMEHNRTKLRLKYGVYGNGRTAIELSTLNGQPYATATVNIPDALLHKDEVIIKTYSENEGILEMLEQEGIVERTGMSATSGMITAPICKLLKKTS